MAPYNLLYLDIYLAPLVAQKLRGQCDDAGLRVFAIITIRALIFFDEVVVSCC